MSNIDLENKHKELKNEKQRNCIFAGLYSLTATGTLVATIVTGGTSSIGTVPASIVAGVSAADSIDKYTDNNIRLETISDILDKRSDAEIKFYNNKNAITVLSNTNCVIRKKKHYNDTINAVTI